MTPTPVAHNPVIDRLRNSASPSLNAVLTASGTNFTSDASSTQPTYFKARAADTNRLVAISLEECTVAGSVVTTVAPVGGFALDLYRTIDEGHSYQLFKTYTSVTEVIEEYMAFESVYYRFQLRTKGANSIRVRAIAVS